MKPKYYNNYYWSFSHWNFPQPGGGGGLGKHLAVSFAKCGATIVLWDIEKGRKMFTRYVVYIIGFIFE